MEGVEGVESETIAPDVVLNINLPWPPLGRIVGEGAHLNPQAAHITFEDGFMQMFLLLLSGMRTASLLAIAMPFPTLTPSSRTNTILKIRDRILIVCNKVMLKFYCYYYYYYYDHDRHYYD